MRLFHKKKDWDDLTYGQVERINAILNDRDIIAKDFEIMRVVYGEEKGDISFLTKPFKPIHHKKTYKVNDHQYYLAADITRFTVSQYIDYQSAKSVKDYVAVCLIPQNHKYLDGYDIDDVYDDIKDMRFLDIQAISNFVKRQFRALLIIIADYFKSKPMEMKMKVLKLTLNPDMQDKIRMLDLAGMEFSRLFLDYARSLT